MNNLDRKEFEELMEKEFLVKGEYPTYMQVDWIKLYDWHIAEIKKAKVEITPRIEGKL